MGSAVLPNIKPGDIKFMENILSVGKFNINNALRIQAVLGRAEAIHQGSRLDSWNEPNDGEWICASVQ